MFSLQPILYYSIFNYPLTKEEIFLYSKTTDKAVINFEIEKLLKLNIINKQNAFYVYNNSNDIVSKRLKGNKQASLIMPKAINRAQFISKFPYVESVSISGSLSKGYYDNDGDLDFFIITKPNRLWVARTLLILYKKIVLRNSKKYFCVNYFISTNHLEIAEKNLFTATELNTLIPVTGIEVFKSFQNKNNWSKTNFPNTLETQYKYLTNVKPYFASKCIEKILNGSLGEKLDDIFKNLTIKKWSSKFTHLEKEQFKIALKSTKSVSKHHPKNFQKKVINAYQKKQLEFEKKFKIKCS